MAVDLNSLGFRNVQEIPHGGRVELGYYGRGRGVARYTADRDRL